MELNLPNSFLELLSSCTLQQKKAMAVHLNNIIKCEIKNTLNAELDFSKYVDYVKDFVPADNFDEEILADVESLGVFKKAKKGAVSQWLSSDTRDYCFSDSPRFKHPPKPISNYKGICKLLKLVNDDSRTTQNLDAALVICYNTRDSALNFHNDAEKLIDSNSSIATISFGASRTMEFCVGTKRPNTAEYSFKVSHHDMVIMKPGCQEILKHRICPESDDEADQECEEWRVCISFRKLNSITDEESDPDISFGCKAPVVDNSPSTPSTHIQKMNLVVGDSFSAGLDEGKLSRNGRMLVKNISSGGATINDVCKQLDDFYISNNHPVSKFFVCVGANDIRHCREKGIRHLKSPLNDLARQIRTQFPSASVWFQTLIPLPHQHNFTEVNVMQYNQLLYEICLLNRIYYLDCFSSFLTHDGFRSEHLFHNRLNIHPNNRGLSVLARIYLKLIHSRRFNPLGY